MKRKFGIIVSILISLLGVVNAQTITFDVQGNGDFGYGCIVPIDVYVDTRGKEITAIDLVISSSMEYKDFEKTEMFPYYFSPKISDNGMIHIVGFAVDQSERVVGSGKIGTLYFQNKGNSIDGSLKLLFLGEGETVDSNLSMAGGIDVLKQVGDAYVRFSEDLPSCSQESVNSELAEIDGFADKNPNQQLNETMDKISNKYQVQNSTSQNFVSDEKESNLRICGGIGLLLLIIIFVVYKILSNKKGKNKGSI